MELEVQPVLKLSHWKPEWEMNYMCASMLVYFIAISNPSLYVCAIPSMFFKSFTYQNSAIVTIAKDVFVKDKTDCRVAPTFTYA